MICPSCHYEELWPGESLCVGCWCEEEDRERRGYRPLAGKVNRRLTPKMKQAINQALDAKEGPWTTHSSTN
jgi:hypothetical protein